MSYISKVELKYQLQKMGINIVKGNYVRRKDIEKIITSDESYENEKHTTYKDLFKEYAREDKRRKKKRLLAVLRTPHDSQKPTTVHFVIHADCGMLTPNMKMPLGFEWDAYPIDSLKPEHIESAKHEVCALGDECLYYNEESRIY
jgi:hypothetical protein